MADLETSFLIYRLGERRFGLLLDGVERVLRAMAVVPLPQAHPLILGLVNIQGEILPVLQTRVRLGLPPRPLSLEDRMIVVKTKTRKFVLIVDAIEGVASRRRDEFLPAAAVAPEIAGLTGVVPLPDGILLIHDVDAFLSSEEEDALRSVLPHVSSAGSGGMSLSPSAQKPPSAA